MTCQLCSEQLPTGISLLARADPPPSLKHFEGTGIKVPEAMIHHSLTEPEPELHGVCVFLLESICIFISSSFFYSGSQLFCRHFPGCCFSFSSVLLCISGFISSSHIRREFSIEKFPPQGIELAEMGKLGLDH